MLCVIGVITSLIFGLVDLDGNQKAMVGIIAGILFVVIYIIIWIYSNHRQNIKLKINTSDVEVKFGDLFAEAADLKVIAFNEYYDTLVDDIVIEKGSLNGEFIEEIFQGSVADLDNIISADTYLPKMVIEETSNRSVGKKTKYKLGSICVVNKYLLTAFTHFDDDNKAYLSINEYVMFLLCFWSEIDRLYASRTVALPILGSGITRFRGYENISDQELLELIIWSFKVSRIKLTYPSKLNIIVLHDKKDKISLTALKRLE
jgi:hypothetical protein